MERVRHNINDELICFVYSSTQTEWNKKHNTVAYTVADIYTFKHGAHMNYCISNELYAVEKYDTKL